MAWRVEVDTDKCTGDEECVNVCPVGVFEMQDEKAVPVNEDEMSGVRELYRGLPLGRDHDNGNLSAAAAEKLTRGGGTLVPLPFLCAGG